LEILDRHKILSVPVYQIDSFYGQKQYLGFLDSLDIAYYLGFITQLESSKEPTTALDEKLRISVNDFFNWQKQNSNIPEKNFYIFDPVSRLGELFKVMAKNPHESVHRVLVRQQGSLDEPLQHRILTETDLIDFFIENLPKTFLDIKVENLQLESPIGSPDIPFLKSSSSAIEAFQKMYTDTVSALPILDEDFKLITTISSSDTKSLRAIKIEDMFQPVLVYLKKRYNGTLCSPITVLISGSLGEVLSKCSRVHRVWIVDSCEKVIGAISQTDVIRCIDLHSPEKQ